MPFRTAKPNLALPLHQLEVTSAADQAEAALVVATALLLLEVGVEVGVADRSMFPTFVIRTSPSLFAHIETLILTRRGSSPSTLAGKI